MAYNYTTVMQAYKAGFVPNKHAFRKWTGKRGTNPKPRNIIKK